MTGAAGGPVRRKDDKPAFPKRRFQTSCISEVGRWHRQRQVQCAGAEGLLPELPDGLSTGLEMDHEGCNRGSATCSKAKGLWHLQVILLSNPESDLLPPHFWAKVCSLRARHWSPPGTGLCPEPLVPELFLSYQLTSKATQQPQSSTPFCRVRVSPQTVLLESRGFWVLALNIHPGTMLRRQLVAQWIGPQTRSRSCDLRCRILSGLESFLCVAMCWCFS